MKIRSVIESDLKEVMLLLQKVKLPLKGVEENFTHFFVMESEGKITGVIGLEKYETKGLVRSLGVVPDEQGKGMGGKLLEAVIQRAIKESIDELFLLTETAEKFFSARGFEVIDRDKAAREVQDSVEFKSVCPLSAVCMKKKL